MMSDLRVDVVDAHDAVVSESHPVSFVLPFHEVNSLAVLVLDYYVSDIGLDLVGSPVCCLKKIHTYIKSAHLG
jgi:hypothetical protein